MKTKVVLSKHQEFNLGIRFMVSLFTFIFSTKNARIFSAFIFMFWVAQTHAVVCTPYKAYTPGDTTINAGTHVTAGAPKRVYRCNNGEEKKCRSTNQTKYAPDTGTNRNDAWTDKGLCDVVASSSSSSSSSSKSSSSVATSSSSSSKSSSKSSSSVATSSSSSSTSSYAPAQTPLFLTANATPHIALVMSIDQELSKKAYTDYSNLDGGTFTKVDKTYRDDFTYYGYFDSDWCYTYEATAQGADNYFKPAKKVISGHSCSTSATNVINTAGAWSGNFLNWATMTRMDILRKVLFGGKRSVDTTTQTILERAYLPDDIHSFVKVYDGEDIYKYTPFSKGTYGKSFCNTSTGKSGYPIIKIADGAYPEWAAKSLVQCNLSGTQAPSAVLTNGILTVKVEVCVSGKDGGATGFGNTDRCREYSTTSVKKPSGILQRHGEDNTKPVKFSLTTGTYAAHLKGGVLRKKASLLAGNTPASLDEINLATGQFTTTDGIISNINKFSINKWDGGKYSDCNEPGILIDTVKADTVNKTCSDWGNPLAEIYLEMLRYISGKAAGGAAIPTGDFNKADAGLTSVATWDDPWTEWCASCSAIVISTGSNSFDGDQLNAPKDIPGLDTFADIQAKTNKVGDIEKLSGKKYYTGTANKYCEGQTYTGLAAINGICPELPSLEGTYNIAGLAYHAHITDLRPTLHGPIPPATPANPNPVALDKQTLTTYTVDLAESLPSLNFNVNSHQVSLVPFCQSFNTNTTQNPKGDWIGCTLIDVVVNEYEVGKGSFTFFWEDSLWGNDNDLDVSQKVDFCIGTACGGGVNVDEIRLTTTMPSAAAGFHLRVSYSIYGVTEAKGTFNTTVNGKTSTRTPLNNVVNITNFPGGLFQPYVDCTNCWWNNPADASFVNGGNSVVIFKAGSSSAVTQLEKPLWYAAKYGSFIDDVAATTPVVNEPDHDSEWDKDGNEVPDNFFSVKNPAKLEDSLELIIQNIKARSGSAAAVATTSTRLASDTFVYQGVFESQVWTGELKAYSQNQTTGLLNKTPAYRTLESGRMPESSAGRKIFTYKSDGSLTTLGKQTVEFEEANLHASQIAKLTLSGDTPSMVTSRIQWLKGDKDDEGQKLFLRDRSVIDPILGKRRNILGDIVNSSPAYLGAFDFSFEQLPEGGDSYRAFYRDKRAAEPLVFVGANDGMLHAFIANSQNSSEILKEKFAYIPNFAFDKLANLTRADYGSSANPHQFMVDGAITVGDVYFDSDQKWHHIVVGSMGAGAKGIYALDVTERDAPKVLFEYSHPSMGYLLGKFYIVPTTNDRWAVVFGNGVGSGTTSKLFVVDIEDPFNESGTGATKIIDTGEGIGLSSPTVLLNNIGQLSSVYAGDLSGNLFRFMLSDPNNSNWSKYKIFKAQSPSAGNPDQPITAAPAIGYNKKNKKYMAYFGTGKYFDTGDNAVGKIQQSFYAVADKGPSVLSTRGNLFKKSMTTVYGSHPARSVALDQPNWKTQAGWYIDLDIDGTMDERVTTKAALVQNRLLITTLIPTTESCTAGGKSWFMNIGAVDMTPPPEPPLLEEAIYTDVGSLSLVTIPPSSAGSSSVGSTGSSSSSSSVGGCQSMTASFIRSGINADTTQTGVSEKQQTMQNCNLGRQSWRQLR